MDAKEKAIKSLEGFRLNVTLNLDVDYDIYKISDIEKALDVAIQEAKKEVFDDIDNAYKYLHLHSVEELVNIHIVKRELLKVKERHLSTFAKSKSDIIADKQIPQIDAKELKARRKELLDHPERGIPLKDL